MFFVIILASNPYLLLKVNNLGRYAFFTVNILTFQVYYWTVTLAAEVLHYQEYTKASSYARKLFIFAHRYAAFNSTLGLILGILFLKLVYFEPTWRATTLKSNIDRGLTNFGEKGLFQHLNQFPSAIMDILLIKDRSVLRELCMNITDLSKALVLFCGCYFLVMRVDYMFVNKAPYPFLNKIIGQPIKELIFIIIVAIFCFFIAAMVNYFAYTLFEIIET